MGMVVEKMTRRFQDRLIHSFILFL